MKKYIITVLISLSVLISIVIFTQIVPYEGEPELKECIELQYTYRGGQLHKMDYCFDELENYSNFQRKVIKQFNEKHNIDSSGICCKDHVCVNNQFDVCMGNDN